MNAPETVPVSLTPDEAELIIRGLSVMRPVVTEAERVSALWLLNKISLAVAHATEAE